MIQILTDWLIDKLDIYCFDININNIGEKFKDGVLFGRLLQKYHIMPTIYTHSLKKKIYVEDRNIHEIACAQTSTVLNLLQKMYSRLESKDIKSSYKIKFISTDVEHNSNNLTDKSSSLHNNEKLSHTSKTNSHDYDELYEKAEYASKDKWKEKIFNDYINHSNCWSSQNLKLDNNECFQFNLIQIVTGILNYEYGKTEVKPIKIKRQKVAGVIEGINDELSSLASIGKIIKNKLSSSKNLQNADIINCISEFIKTFQGKHGWVLLEFPTYPFQMALLEYKLTGQIPIYGQLSYDKLKKKSSILLYDICTDKVLKHSSITSDILIDLIMKTDVDAIKIEKVFKIFHLENVTDKTDSENDDVKINDTSFILNSDLTLLSFEQNQIQSKTLSYESLYFVSNITDKTALYLCENITTVDWRDFAVQLFELPILKIDDLFFYRKEFNYHDQGDETVSENIYKGTKLWFEDGSERNNDIKLLLYELFKVKNGFNYSAMLLAFCRDAKSWIGLKKAFCLIFDNNPQEDLKEANNHIRELEDTLCDYDEVVLQRNQLQEKVSSFASWLDSVICKQTKMFSELIMRYDELCSKYTLQREHVNKDREENMRLRCELSKLTDGFQLQEKSIVELENAKLDLKNETCKLHKRLSDVTGASNQVRVRLEETEHTLQNKERSQAQILSLNNTMSELKSENENTITKLQAEITGLQYQLNFKTAEIDDTNKLLEEHKQKLEVQCERQNKLKRMIEELRTAHLQEKYKADQEICALKNDAEIVNKELRAINRKLCDAQMEKERLKCQLNEQLKTVKRLENNLEQQHQAAKRSKQTAEISAQKNITEREQLNNEIKLRERKINLLTQEVGELKRLNEDRSQQILQLKAQRNKLKASTNQNPCEQPDTFTSVLDRHAEILISGEETTYDATCERKYCLQSENNDRSFESAANIMKEHFNNLNESINDMKNLILSLPSPEKITIKEIPYESPDENNNPDNILIILQKLLEDRIEIRKLLMDNLKKSLKLGMQFPKPLAVNYTKKQLTREEKIMLREEQAGKKNCLDIMGNYPSLPTGLCESKLLIKSSVLNKHLKTYEYDESTSQESYIYNESREEKNNNEECIIDSSQLNIEGLFQRKSFAPFHIYLERMITLKNNFASCEAGRYFFEKTEPLWDSITNCIYRKSEILNQMIDSVNTTDIIPEAYKNCYDQLEKKELKLKESNSLKKLSFFESLMNDLNYELVDEEIIKAITIAKNILSTNITAHEIIAIASVILDYETDVRSNVLYIIDGLCGRTIFEYSKRRFAKENSLNSWNIGRKKIFAFIQQHKNKCPVSSKDILHENTKSSTGYSLSGLNHINNYSEIAVNKLFSIVYKRLAGDLAGTTITPVFYDYGEELTKSVFGSIVRKMTKIMFSIGGPYEETTYVLGVVIDKVVSELRKRSPKVVYNSKKKKLNHL
ncbi:cytadherence high molecular weight protein 2-like [Daktulosphaira vitifoliae]|uniref:cytadherence high molecular weight protein 2-like n=1 Tax=Daktulosphaira vitifoliae TaxID=58002 RepID=UPI0021AA6480|nr:cytadherence high molecular weight protein 2-like [Daktulosphaira vitifoliae]